MPLVSCIMPSIRPEMAIRALQMFAAQRSYHAELIVIADGAQHTYKQIGGQIHWHTVQPGMSIGAKRNLAVNAAKGKIIVHWDDDDWHGPRRIEEAADALLYTDALLAGYRQAAYLDEQGQAWQYSGAPGYLVGMSLAYWRHWAIAHPFPDIFIGEDNALLHATPSDRRHAIEDGDQLVGRIHRGNTAEKLTMCQEFSPQSADWLEERFSWQDDLDEELTPTVRNQLECLVSL